MSYDEHLISMAGGDGDAGISLTPRDRGVIAAAYEVDAAKCRRYPTHNPFVLFWFRSVASFLESRASSIREAL